MKECILTASFNVEMLKSSLMKSTDDEKQLFGLLKKHTNFKKRKYIDTAMKQMLML